MGELIGHAFGVGVIPTLLFFGLAATGLKTQRKSSLGLVRGLKLFALTLVVVFVCNLAIYIVMPAQVYSVGPSLLGIVQSLLLPLAASAVILYAFWKDDEQREVSTSHGRRGVMVAVVASVLGLLAAHTVIGYQFKASAVLANEISDRAYVAKVSALGYEDYKSAQRVSCLADLERQGSVSSVARDACENLGSLHAPTYQQKAAAAFPGVGLAGVVGIYIVGLLAGLLVAYLVVRVAPSNTSLQARRP